ncbi:MAG: 4-hydroxy-tetrahydrodipicolinate synthase [Clostridia bacterium]|nr:4-hydroxy-tetrahydrodipicolinate synthase [Clostridia bacterium]
MSIFQGSATALITPFNSKGEIDFNSLARLLDFQLENKTDALVVLGTTGEPSTMTTEEKTAVATFAIKHVNKRIPIILGSGGNCTAEVIKSSQHMESLGADGLLIVTPYYNKCTQNGLYEHYKAVADSVKLPIVAYNVPGRTGVNILPATMGKLAGIGNIVAIKEACGNMEQIADTARLIGNNAALYSGDDAIVVPLLSVGGAGVISVASNVIPEIMHNMVEAYLSGDTKTARDIQLRLLPFIKALFSEVNPIPVKMAASLLGLCEPYMRLPLTVMEEANVEKLRHTMRELNLLR